MWWLRSNTYLGRGKLGIWIFLFSVFVKLTQMLRFKCHRHCELGRGRETTAASFDERRGETRHGCGPVRSYKSRGASIIWRNNLVQRKYSTHQKEGLLMWLHWKVLLLSILDEYDVSEPHTRPQMSEQLNKFYSICVKIWHWNKVWVQNMTENPYIALISLAAERRTQRCCSFSRWELRQQTRETRSLITHRNVSAIALVKFQTTQRVRVTVWHTAATPMLTLTRVPGANCN